MCFHVLCCKCKPRDLERSCSQNSVSQPLLSSSNTEGHNQLLHEVVLDDVDSMTRNDPTNTRGQNAVEGGRDQNYDTAVSHSLLPM